MSLASVLSVRQDHGWPKDVVWARWGRQWTTSFHERAAGIKPFSVYFSQLPVSASAVIALAGPVPQIDEVRRRAEALLSNAGFPAVHRALHIVELWHFGPRPGRPGRPKPNCRRSRTIGQHSFDGPDRVGNEGGVGAPVVRDAENAGEHPAFTPLPGSVVDAKRVAVSLAGVGREQAPGDDRVDGGVTNSAGAPVDDGGELAVLREQVEI